MSFYISWIVLCVCVCGFLAGRVNFLSFFLYNGWYYNFMCAVRQWHNCLCLVSYVHSCTKATWERPEITGSKSNIMWDIANAVINLVRNYRPHEPFVRLLWFENVATPHAIEYLCCACMYIDMYSWGYHYMMHTIVHCICKVGQGKAGSRAIPYIFNKHVFTEQQQLGAIVLHFK